MNLCIYLSAVTFSLETPKLKKYNHIIKLITILIILIRILRISRDITKDMLQKISSQLGFEPPYLPLLNSLGDVVNLLFNN